MQIPVKAHYAAIAMLALAARYRDGELVSARTVSAEHDVPNQFLVQILQQLRSAGLVCSSRGSSGGFKLQRSPESITLAEIVDAVCSPQQLSTTSEVGESDLNRVMSQVWDDVIQQQRNQLEQRSLQSLLDQANALSAESMFYI
ncbi:MAG: Rrf2 family transcriptional regulator [Pirellulaceae bacterium]|nr:Rrf2 family transcriptional regulator [Pirellulaceae bacterium]